MVMISNRRIMVGTKRSAFASTPADKWGRGRALLMPSWKFHLSECVCSRNGLSITARKPGS
jgi:hypothetical protein